MEFEALVIQLLPMVKGVSSRGEWVKQEVVFEQAGEFGRKVCVSFWGDKAQDAAELKPGEKVKVSANVESREHNGRWYTEVRAWKLAKEGGRAAASPFGNASSAPDFGGAAARAPRGQDFPPISASGQYEGGSAEDISKEDFDDLPF